MREREVWRGKERRRGRGGQRQKCVCVCVRVEEREATATLCSSYSTHACGAPLPCERCLRASPRGGRRSLLFLLFWVFGVFRESLRRSRFSSFLVVVVVEEACDVEASDSPNLSSAPFHWSSLSLSRFLLASATRRKIKASLPRASKLEMASAPALRKPSRCEKNLPLSAAILRPCSNRAASARFPAADAHSQTRASALASCEVSSPRLILSAEEVMARGESRC